MKKTISQRKRLEVSNTVKLKRELLATLHCSFPFQIFIYNGYDIYLNVKARRPVSAFLAALDYGAGLVYEAAKQKLQHS